MGIGAHFRHKTKPLSPVNTVLLNLLPVGEKHKTHEALNLSGLFQNGSKLLFFPEILINKMYKFSSFTPAIFIDCPLTGYIIHFSQPCDH